MEKMKKRTTTAFGKKIYLLAEDKDGTKYWLEAPSWDCRWYWGFGYIETYTNNEKPAIARDIQSHQHWDGFITGPREKGGYIHHINENPDFFKTTLTEKESWEMAELMKSFYTLEEAAAFFGRGGSHITTSPISESLTNKEITEKINTEYLPAIFKEIDRLLTPDE